MARVATDIVERTRRKGQRALTAERLWYGGLAVLAGLVLVVGAIAAAASRPATCAVCHAGEASSLQADAHRKLTCDDCHASVSAWQLYGDRLAVVDMVVRQVVPGTSNRSAGVENARCLLCHDDARMAETVVIDGIKMNHRAPVEKRLSCVTCHPDVGHGAHPDRRPGYTMDMCMSCHSSNAENPATCTTCHDEAAGGRRHAADRVTPWRVTHGAQWRTSHGMGDLATCRGCHAEKFCVRCHGVPVPHDDGYVDDHGALVSAMGAEDRTSCTTCHKASACRNCHGVDMPHPAGFLKGHPALVEKSGKTVCMRCHAQKSCDACHERHTHPGLDPAYLKQLKARPVTPR